MRRAWLTLTLLAAAGLLTALFLGDHGGWVERWLACSRGGLARGELWRLITGPLIHASAGHAIRDLLTLAVLGTLWERDDGHRYRAALLLGLVLAPVTAFATSPSLQVYFGLSGAVYAALAAGLFWQWRRGPRPLLAVILVLVVVKVVVETVTGQLVVPVGHPASVAPIPVAHLAGLGCGVVAMLWPTQAQFRTH